MATHITHEQLLEIAQSIYDFIAYVEKGVKKDVNDEKMARLDAIQTVEITHSADMAKIQKSLEDFESSNSEAFEKAEEEFNKAIEEAKSGSSEAIEAAKTELRQEALEAMQQMQSDLEGKIAEEAAAREQIEQKVDALDIPVPATEEDIKPILDLFQVPEE